MKRGICRPLFGFVWLLLMGFDRALCEGQLPKVREQRAKRPDWQRVTHPIIVSSQEEMEKLISQLAESSGSPSLSSVEMPQGASPTELQDAWSAWVSSESLETAVKQELRPLQDALVNPSHFAAQGFRDAQQAFRRLSVLFAVIGNYPDEMRWQASATAVSGYFHHAAQRLRSGGTVELSHATKGRDALRDLLNGTFSVSAAQSKLEWAQIVARVSAMRWMEELVETRMTPRIANSREFKRTAREFRQNAEILAAIATALTMHEIEGLDDTDYRSLAESFRDEVRELVKTVRTEDYEQTRVQLGKVTQSCVTCHGEFR